MASVAITRGKMGFPPKIDDSGDFFGVWGFGMAIALWDRWCVRLPTTAPDHDAVAFSVFLAHILVRGHANSTSEDMVRFTPKQNVAHGVAGALLTAKQQY